MIDIFYYYGYTIATIISKIYMARKSRQTYDKIEIKDVKPGMIIRLHQEIKELNPKGEEKKRIQVFEGMVLRRRGGSSTGATITLRKVSDGVGVEKIFPIALPSIKKIELVKKFKVRRANIGFVRTRTKKKRLKELVRA